MYPGPGRARSRPVRRAARAGAARARARGRPRSARHARRRQAALPDAGAADAARAPTPDVVYAHFLVPSGLIAALAGRAPLVVTAHGRDVRNIGAHPGHRRARHASSSGARRRSSASREYLRRELEAKVPEARGKTEVVSSGVDLERFAVGAARRTGRRASSASARSTERKNVVRLADAFARSDEGTLTFAGDGPLRAQLEGRERVALLGRVPHDEIPRLLAESHVLCQPSLIEPLGQALLEAMACGRSVVATRIGGPPEFVPPEAGCSSTRSTSTRSRAPRGARRRSRARTRPRARGRGSTTSAVRRSGSRRSSAGRLLRSASLISTSGRIVLLEAGLARERERLLPALARLLRVDALLQPVVAGDEQLLDPLVGVVALHKETVTRHIRCSVGAMADSRAHRRRSSPLRRGARGDPRRRRPHRGRRRTRGRRRGGALAESAAGRHPDGHLHAA